MNTRYSFQPDSLCTSSTAVPFSSNPHGVEERIVVGMRNRPPRAPPSSILIRTAMRISRARWFNFLRRVFHYQNGSRSDLGSNPFNSSTWMMLEFLALVIQISIIAFTLAISKEERPIWPMRIWIVGYDIGCVLSLLLLYGNYHLHITQGDRFGLSDIEQQRTNEESSLLGYNMNMGSIDRGASDDQISRLPSWRYKEINTNLDLDHDLNCGTSQANEDPECCICLANYKDKEEVRQLPCSHIFHLKCVDQWLRIISCCPLCKQALDR
ncbi:hypothetical protein Goklo_001202 [Gossypium klotzschianum]|uniref:RING-type domain-containing protein n=1 Tax=Gossypium klotzschianum TaxID=34286 RepID=A0A7J8W072_9ROSI|nr:hypothetical protein [Gossypium klotzschianum]